MSFLRMKKFAKVVELERSDPVRLIIQWKTIGNDVDCAIFAMRHMETYFGGGTRSYDSEIAIQSVIFHLKNQYIFLKLMVNR